MKIKLKWRKKLHIHVPADPVAVALIRADNLTRGNTGVNFFWRCICGEMVNDNDNK